MEKATALTVASDNIIPYVIFHFHEGVPICRFHELSHIYASLMIAGGTPLAEVSHQLGHAQASTTANIYAHVIASAEAKAVQTFDRFNDIIAPDQEAVAKAK